jgi:hypothetical protein
MGEIDGWLLVSGSRGELPYSPVSICHLSSDICPLFFAKKTLIQQTGTQDKTSGVDSNLP